jgi:flagellar biosynthesis/type III secretory pathway protein FliH
MERIIMKDPIIKDAITHLNDISSDARARERARAREKSEHDWASMMADARRAGLAEGEAKGKAEGEAKGKVEVLKSLLKNPVTAGLLDAELAALVSLPPELIAEVRASLRP